MDAGIHKKILGAGASRSGTTTLIISNEEMKDIIKIVVSWNSGLLITQMKQRGGFLGMLLGTLGASLLQNMLARKGVMWVDYGVNRAE